jgi:beta-lactam-binding protein with PASTA domain
VGDREERWRLPSLVGNTVSQANRAMSRTLCNYGKLRRKRAGSAKRGRVISQHPAPGTRLPALTPVTIVVGA